MRLKIGIWAGGDPNNSAGTIEWAGGKTDYTAAPFKMFLESVKVVNYNPADQYTYSDKTGSWESIKASNTTGGSSLADRDTTESSKTSSKAAAADTSVAAAGWSGAWVWGSFVSMVVAGMWCV